MELKQDLYIIPLLSGSLVYSPLRRGLFWASDEACQIIESYLSGDMRVLKQKVMIYQITQGWDRL